jgi:hypothetical protein
MVCLTREQILGAAGEPKREAVTVKAWGGTFYVQEWSAGQYDAWEQAVIENRKNVRAITVVHGLFTEDGARVFQDDDADAVGARPSFRRDVDRIAKKVRALNRLDAADYEEEQGNSEPDRSDSSASS